MVWYIITRAVAAIAAVSPFSGLISMAFPALITNPANLNHIIRYIQMLGNSALSELETVFLYLSV